MSILSYREYRGNVEFPEMSMTDEIGWQDHLDLLAYGYQSLTGQKNFDIVLTETKSAVIMIGILPQYGS